MNEEIDNDWEEMFARHTAGLHAGREPSPLLEERTVRELRARGLLQRPRRGIPAAWLVGSVAASLALFASGVIVGQYIGTRNAVGAVAEVQKQTDAITAAQQVQRAGTAYVQALEALVSSARQSQTPGQSKQARDVALTALHQAANQIVQLAPNDPVTANILQGLEQEQKQNQPRASKPAQRKIVWF